MGAVLALVPGFLSLVLGFFKSHAQAANPATPLPGWIATLTNLLADLPSLEPFNSTGNDIANAQAIIGDIIANGSPLIPADILSGLTTFNGALTTYAATAKDYVEGQVAVLAGFSFEGVPGHDFAISDAGLANPIPQGVTTIGGALGIS